MTETEDLLRNSEWLVLGLVDRNRTGSSRAYMDAQTGDQSNRRVRMPCIGGVPNIRQYSRLN